MATHSSVPMLLDRRRMFYLATVGGLVVALAAGVMLCLGLSGDGAAWVRSAELVVLSAGLLAAGIACGIALQYGRKVRGATVDTWLPVETAVARKPGLEVQSQRFHTMSLLAIPLSIFLVVMFGLMVWLSVVVVRSPALAILPGVPLAVGGFGSLTAWAGWNRRARSVRKTGWYAAKVVDVEVFEGRAAPLPLISIGFEDGSTIRLRSIMSTYDARYQAGRRNAEAWVGGEDTAMVVLFENGAFRKGLYPVPVKALGPRTFPPSSTPPRDRAGSPSWVKRVGR
ncbi:hypothetical protein [Amycolatopsis alba]|uniref:hypothetical protein n=1 Tax=Amycolatopsis alba TaxID=76020 RepID=UPI0011782FF0|nr:hypothetical protein [Amycolatopsis alba]